MSDLEALELLFNGGKVSDDGGSLSFEGMPIIPIRPHRAGPPHRCARVALAL